MWESLVGLPITLGHRAARGPATLSQLFPPCWVVVRTLGRKQGLLPNALENRGTFPFLSEKKVTGEKEPTSVAAVAPVVSCLSAFSQHN